MDLQVKKDHKLTEEDPIENLISVFDTMYPVKDEINQAFNRFITHNEDPRQFSFVRSEVAESWIRSRSYGVTTDPDLLNRKVKPSTLKRVMRENQLLIEVVKPVLLKELAFLRRHSDFGVFLFDRNSIVLFYLNTNESFSLHDDSGTNYGVDLSEQSIGTSSHSMSILLDKPFLIIPTENFNRAIQLVTAAISVPIHNPKGHVIGTLTFAYPRVDDLYLANQGMFRGMISFQMSLVKKIENLLEINARSQALFNTMSLLTEDSLIAVNRWGEIQKMNSRAEKLLEGTSDNFKGRIITEILGNEKKLMNALSKNKQSEDIPTHILLGTKKDCVMRVVPFDFEEGAIIRLTEQKLSQVSSNKHHSETLGAMYSFSDILGDSPEIVRAKQFAKKFAATPRNILLLGESGTGKELFAHAIHNASRPEGPFITINCASLPRGLVESEFFGYEAGSFTGADRKGRVGKLEMANGGTLFLDEIGDMPLGFQPILLRVLEDKRVMRIGGNQYIPTNFRVVAATNKNIQELISQNLFREDLFYRLCSLKVLIPSLQDRISDIPMLVRHFIQKQCKEYNLPIPEIEPDVDKVLISYDWPGNIRELQNVIGVALSLAEDGMIKVKDLPTEILIGSSEAIIDIGRLESIEEAEKLAIQNAMISTEHNVKKAAQILKISRTTLYQKLRKYNISINKR